MVGLSLFDDRSLIQIPDILLNWMFVLYCMSFFLQKQFLQYPSITQICVPLIDSATLLVLTSVSK